MPATRATGKSSSVGSAGLALFVSGISVFVIYTVIALSADSHDRAELEAALQAAANAAAEGAVSQLPKGSVAVVGTACRILESQRAKSLPHLSEQPEIQVGHRERGGEAFSTGLKAPNAVRVTIRLREARRFLGVFPRFSERQIEVRAVAVLQPAGSSLVAEAAPTSSDARR